MNFQRLKKNPVLRILFAPYIWIKRYFIHRSYEKFYKQYDRMMRLVCSDSLEINLRDFGGVFSVGKESLLAKYILKEGAYEPDIVELVKSHLNPNADALDIGANVGFFTVLLGKSIHSDRRVLAAEPTPGALRRLKINLERNEVENVVLHEGLVGKTEEDVAFNIVEGREEYSSMKPIAHEHAVEFETREACLPCKPVDTLVESYGLEPGFMKIDVEGAEWEVFQGSVVTLEKYHPVILAELDDRLLKGFDASANQVCDFLRSKGYEVFDADGLGPVRPHLTTSILAIPAHS